MSVDLSQILFDESDSPHEALVQAFLERIRRNQEIPMPVLAKDVHGRTCVVHGREQFEAARRSGETTIHAYVMNGVFSPDALKKLRQELKQARPSN